MPAHIFHLFSHYSVNIIAQLFVEFKQKKLNKLKPRSVILEYLGTDEALLNRLKEGVTQKVCSYIKVANFVKIFFRFYFNKVNFFYALEENIFPLL
ncbi:hypothetical protein HX99_06170 [Peptococcaceae bacterium SCADC1_2_3]|nr:hypothetical protein HX99_06170 [Peptococcaceae bacterium SCADC1_2_3]KFI38039.1 hypothetical protein HY02_09555 [Peptococcaceae bacterium SCADC1_2_3]HBQ28315.1 hypothetical protein [Desulfotomaculum sp.]